MIRYPKMISFHIFIQLKYLVGVNNLLSMITPSYVTFFSRTDTFTTESNPTTK